MRLRTEGLSWREIDGETILLDLHSSTYFRTNQTGTALLKALVDGSDRDALAQALVEAYDLPAEQAGNDVDAFVGQLEARGLLAGGAPAG